MANTVITIGKQTTNLLSNDNLIIYSDISMNSEFNAAAISLSEAEKPNPADYLLVLATENIYHTKNTNTPQNGPVSLTTTVENNEVEIDIFPNSNYSNALANYYNRLNTSKFRVAKNINVRAIQQSIHNIFTWIPGERVLNPEFGNNLYKLLYEGITKYNEEQIIAEIRRCLAEYEPRVKLSYIKNVSSNDDTENNIIRMEIVYTIPSLNEDQYSYTYIYHKDKI